MTQDRDTAALKAEVKILTHDDHATLVKHFGRNKDGSLKLDEIQSIVEAGKAKMEALPQEVKAVIIKFNVDCDGHLKEHELHHLHHEITLTESQLRYAGYTAAFARAFRYLAFTSDFGEALRPVVAKRVVNATYAVAFGYCGADIAWEAWKLQRRNYVTESGVPMSMAQLLAERTAFQAVASLGIPALLIHTTVDVSKHFFRRIGRFTKWGPSVAGLAVIPLLPLYLDQPVEHAIENFFHHYGPWAKRDHEKHE